MCRELEVDGSGFSKKSEFEVVFALVQKVLECTDEETMGIVALRLAHKSKATSSGAAELLALDEGLDLVDKNERQELQREQKEAANDKAAEEAFMRDFRLARTSMLGKGEGRRAPKKTALPPGEITQQQIRHLCPDEAHVWRNNARNGWSGHCQPFARTSALAESHGGSSREALLVALRVLWEQHLLLRGLPKSACRVKGLFDSGKAPIPEARGKRKAGDASPPAAAKAAPAPEPAPPAKRARKK